MNLKSFTKWIVEDFLFWIRSSWKFSLTIKSFKFAIILNFLAIIVYFLYAIFLVRDYVFRFGDYLSEIRD